MPHQWVTFTPKIRVPAKIMGSGERACVRFFHAPVKKCLSIGVSEIEKTKKSQSHQISAKVLILNAPPMSDVHTKNQPPISENGLGRACLRPWFLLQDTAVFTAGRCFWAIPALLEGPSHKKTYSTMSGPHFGCLWLSKNVDYSV